MRTPPVFVGSSRAPIGQPLTIAAPRQEFTVAEAFGDDGKVGGLIAGASHGGLRLYAVQKNASDIPLRQAVDLQVWCAIFANSGIKVQQTCSSLHVLKI